MDVVNLKIKLFADGASIPEIMNFVDNPQVSGFTTNPTLMRSAGVKNYIKFSAEAAQLVFPKPISIEVFADDFDEMFQQAQKLSTLGENVFVKIPVTNSLGQPSVDIQKKLSSLGIRLNVTAIFTREQVEATCSAIASGPEGIVSVFAGRIADTGVDPALLMREYKEIIRPYPKLELLWASPREIINIFQAEAAEVDIITMTTDLWKKIPIIGKDLGEYSLETVKMFREDALKSGYSI